MPNTYLTDKKIKKRVQTRLGSSGVVVELSDDDLKEAIEDTIEFYNQVRPAHLWGAVQASTQQKRYVISGNYPPSNFAMRLAGIVNVSFLKRRSQPPQVDPFDPFSTSLAGVTLGSGSGETYGEIEQRLGYSEAAGRIVDAEPEWEALWEGPEYILYLDIPRAHIQVSFQYTCYYENSDAGRQLIPEGDVGWFIEHCTAVAKQILGRIRSKHGGIASPEGGVDEIDGAALISEGAAELERLHDVLNRRRVPLGPTSPE